MLHVYVVFIDPFHIIIIFNLVLASNFTYYLFANFGKEQLQCSTK